MPGTIVAHNANELQRHDDTGQIGAHWQFDGQDPLPDGLPPDLVRKIMIDNPRRTYPRLS